MVNLKAISNKYHHKIKLLWFVCHCLSGNILPLNFSLLCRFFGLNLIGSCSSPILL
ncbi:hypothetical protein V2J09_013631 [Rumex salicifolius]